jgi:hypothetical protein
MHRRSRPKQLFRDLQLLWRQRVCGSIQRGLPQSQRFGRGRPLDPPRRRHQCEDSNQHNQSSAKIWQSKAPQTREASVHDSQQESKNQPEGLF